MNHLNEKNSVLNRPMYLCLCPVCLGQFLDTGIYKIVRENHGQAKERCDFCNYRNGYDFIIYSKAEKKDEVAGQMAMKKSELRELYLMMFPEYPDIVNITQLQSMLGISRHLAYDLINDGYIRGLKIGNAFRIPKVNVIEYVMDQGKSAI